MELAGRLRPAWMPVISTEQPSLLALTKVRDRMRMPPTGPTAWTYDDDALFYTAQVLSGLLAGVNPQAIPSDDRPHEPKGRRGGLRSISHGSFWSQR